MWVTRHGIDGLNRMASQSVACTSTVDHRVAGRRLHPRIERQDPERRQTGAHCNQHGGQRMHAFGNLADAEQHDRQEGGLEEKRRQHFVGQQRAGHVADRLHVAWPVGAELEAHGHAADHAQREGQREDLHPQTVGIHPARVARAAEAPLEEKQHPGQRNGNAGKQDMEADVGRELDPRQGQRIHAVSILLSRG